MRAALPAFLIVVALSACDAGPRQTRARRRDEVHQDLLRRKAELQELLRRSDELRREQARARAALPATADLPALLSSLQDGAEETETLLVSWKVNPERTVGLVAQTPIDVELTGSFARLAAWIERTQEGPRVVLIDSISIGDRRGEGAASTVTARIQLVATHLGERPRPPSSARETDPTIASDPELRTLEAQLQDLEAIRAVVDETRGRLEVMQGLLRDRRRAGPFLAELRTILAGDAGVWIEALELRTVDRAWTLRGGAATSADVVRFAEQVKRSEVVHEMSIDLEREITTPSPSREFRLSGTIR